MIKTFANVIFFPVDQNWIEDRYEEEAYDHDEEGKYAFRSLSIDLGPVGPTTTTTTTCCMKWMYLWMSINKDLRIVYEASK